MKTITKTQLKKMIKEAIIKEQSAVGFPHDVLELSNLVQLCDLYSRMEPETRQQLKLLLINGKRPQNWEAEKIIDFLEKVTNDVSGPAAQQAKEMKSALHFLLSARKRND